MKSKLILCLALVLSGGLFGCSTGEYRTYRQPNAAEQNDFVKCLLCQCYGLNSNNWNDIAPVFPLKGTVVLSWTINNYYDHEDKYPSSDFIERMVALNIPVKVDTNLDLVGIDSKTGEKRNVLWIARMDKTSRAEAELEVCLAPEGIKDHFEIRYDLERKNRRWIVASAGVTAAPPQFEPNRILFTAP
ncbi:MAG TPA: hypothetical protein VIK59_09980 [Verrucomicrobiae bacterium]